ncbi:hypothetical protein, partial [Fibrobacter sp. UWT2]|uniref:hypothetical protein n=1 Tax=Fibrobacter sp. UWT2 TaxID=1896224 RepID=UPI001C4A276B
DVVLAVPCGMSCRFISIIHFKSFEIIVMQLAGRISIIIKGFLFSAPPEGFFRTTSLAGGFRSYKNKATFRSPLLFTIP